MKYSLLTRLRRNGAFYLTSAFLLLIGIPVYQALVLVPRGYGSALAATNLHHIAFYLAWIGTHTASFLIYRILLLISFALLVSMPFSLFRIIVAQELVAQQEEAELADQNEGEDTDEENDNNDFEEDAESSEEEDSEGETDDVDEYEDTHDGEDGVDEEGESIEVASDGMPQYPWRGKGFAIIAAWSGIAGIFAYVLGTLVSTLFLLIVGHSATMQTTVSATVIVLLSIFSITTNTAGIGLLALSALFFGAVIARRGTRLWPGEWVGFGYVALAVSALLSGSAVSVASAPTSGQTVLTSPAILLFALWIGWLGLMLVRLRPEP